MENNKVVKPAKRSFLSVLFKIFVFLVLAFVLATGVFIYAGYKYYAEDLPDLTDITGYKPDVITEVYSSDGTLIGEFSTQRRSLIPQDEIPEHVKNAFIAVEDKRFFEHEGVDLRSIFGAMAENIREGDWVRGASTITQQVVKNIILSPEKSVSRKIKEAILAHRIENNLSKEEILFLYLNHIYLADGTYGVEQASKNYFGKSARDINVAEAAVLAGLPKRPEYYSPRKNFPRAIARQRLVLEKMEQEGYITVKQKNEARKYQVQILPKKRVNGKIAPYFVEHVRKYLKNSVGNDAYQKGGYKVFTTLDIDLNLEAQWALRRGILEIESRHGRHIVAKKLSDPKYIDAFLKKQKVDGLLLNETYQAAITGAKKREDPDTKAEIIDLTIKIGEHEATLAYAKSLPYGTPIEGLRNDVSKKLAPSNGYKGIDLLPRDLSVGDIIEVKYRGKNRGGDDVFTLAYSPKTQGALMSMDTNGHVKALVGGYDYKTSQFNRATQALRQPGSAFKPIVYSAALDKGYTQTSVVYDIPLTIKDWSPSNYDGNYQGAMLLRKALAKSRNLASVRMIQDIGPKYAAKYAANFGYQSRLNPYPSLALGGSDVKMFEMVTAYNVFATGGKLVKPTFIMRIYDRDGKIIEDNTGGKFVSIEEALKSQRQEERLRIIEQLAAKKGQKLTKKKESNEDFLKEGEITGDEFTENNEANDESYLNAQEFLALLKSDSVEHKSFQKKDKHKVNPETAYIMTDLLQAVITEGTGARAQKLLSKAPLAGKTGTTNDYTDAWFVGYSPKITTAVWIGRDDHKPLGRKEAGSRAALPIWIDYMEDALDKYPGGTFKKPSGVKIVSTPYGNIPYSTESLRTNVLESLRQSPVLVGEEIDEDLYYPKDYGVNQQYGVTPDETETEIDFIMRR